MALPNLLQRLFENNGYGPLLKAEIVAGLRLWRPELDYAPPFLAAHSDGRLYQALKPSGPNTDAGPQDPVSTSDYWRALSQSHSEVYQFVSSNAAWAVPYTGCYLLEVLGGGGGGGATVVVNGVLSASGGGGGGHYAFGLFNLSVNDTLSIVVGALGGAGQSGLSTSNPVGYDGGTSSVTSSANGLLLQAAGGKGGVGRGRIGAQLAGTDAFDTGGLGGVSGGDGHAVLTDTTTGMPMVVRSGHGGSSPYGVGGESVEAQNGTSLPGNSGTGYGSGGSGAACGQPNARYGGTGTQGLIKITFLG